MKHTEFKYDLGTAQQSLDWPKLRDLLKYLGYRFVNEPSYGSYLNVIEVQAEGVMPDGRIPGMKFTELELLRHENEMLRNQLNILIGYLKEFSDFFELASKDQ
ncbi:MAG TPA: hypothetical protein V6C65_38970 [Allocoleopsis sp.]